MKIIYRTTGRDNFKGDNPMALSLDHHGDPLRSFFSKMPYDLTIVCPSSLKKKTYLINKYFPAGFMDLFHLDVLAGSS